ncbi:MAG TPA: cation diffusion facilitator family transporter [Longimicrobiales bacterium]|nr:cation diffusion facilitator family transporter [Longimicrobiales bacterium]
MSRARGLRVARWGLLVNALLVVVKVTAGVLGNSYALIADGVESSLDIFSSLIVWRGLVVAGRSADEQYHFGYGKAESVAGATVAILLLVAALGISIEAVREILRPHHAPAPFTLPVLVLVVLVKEVLFRTVLRVGRDLNSPAVKADAWHHRSDAITSAAAFAGISIALIGGPGWAAADDFAALVASGIIAFNGVRLLRPAIEDLMDRAPAPDVLRQVRASAEGVRGVREVEKILARRAGIGYFVVLHVQADPQLTLADAHQLGHEVKSSIMADVPEVLDAIVHMEPHQPGPTR